MMQIDDLTLKFARLLFEWKADEAAVTEQARLVLIDGIAVALAGSGEGGPRRVGELTRRDGAAAAATVIGQGFASSPALAARVNGVSMHVLDYEPMWNPPNHAVSPLLPALLAIAERAERTGAAPQGRPVLAALARGVEAQGRLRLASGQIEPQSLLFHPPGVVGPLSAAAACAGLLGLDAEGMAAAIGIAASCGAGLIANIGSMTKALHCGNAAMRGVEAAELAAAGFTANSDPLGNPRGYGRAYYGDAYDPAPLVAALQVPRLLDPGMAWKLFPSQFATHFVITAALDCRADIADPAAIERVVVTTPVMSYVDRPDPDSGLAGKFSLQYGVAAALLDGEVDLRTFSDERRFADDMKAMLGRIELRQDPQISGRLDTMHVIVRAALSDGRMVERRCDAPLGSWSRPVPAERIRDKARRLLDEFLEPNDRDTFWSCVDGPLESLRITALMEAVSRRR